VDSKVDSDAAKNLDTYYSSSLQDSSKLDDSSKLEDSKDSKDSCASKRDGSDSGILKETDSLDRTTPADTDESSLESRSKDGATSEDSKSERIISEDKSESSSVKSKNEEEAPLRNQNGDCTEEVPQRPIMDQECHFFEEFENHLTALD
jgi:hypothetical protein